MKYDLSMMIYYHGEEECPFDRGKDNKPYFWSTERIFVANCAEKGLSQARLAARYPERIVGAAMHMTAKCSMSSHWEESLEEYLDGRAFPTKYDLSGMRYFHGEAKCPYEGSSIENFFWRNECKYVVDCEAKGLSQKRMQENYVPGRETEKPKRVTDYFVI